MNAEIVSEENKIIVRAQLALSKKKSGGTAFLLTLLFGPLGALYASIIFGLVLIVVNIAVAIPTLGMGLIIMWPINIIATWAMVKFHNSRIERSVLSTV